MSQSLSQLYVHIIFHVSHNHVAIHPKDSTKLYAYISSLLKQEGCVPMQINGMCDHIHILCILSKNIALSKLLRHIKSVSSGWIKTLDPCYGKFAWQKGYGVFSVSPSVCDKTIRYIIQQEEHHKKMSFQEEYRMFLKEYNVEYQEEYLWED